jgi:hypothetical protein
VVGEPAAICLHQVWITARLKGGDPGRNDVMYCAVMALAWTHRTGEQLSLGTLSAVG